MVTWKWKIPRDNLSVSTRNSLGSISTLFEVREEAAGEILRSVKEAGKPEGVEQTEEQLEKIKEDIVEKAHEFIKDKVLALDWNDAQQLVAGILQAMGYKTRISPPGSDRGKDIEASPDGLGLNEPRIVVEVKHRQGQIGSQELRSFIGTLRSGHKGLYISTGGFSKDAKYEADRATNPVTLIDLDDLVNLIVQYYDNFDSEARSLVSLRKIYWPE
jgi:restriction system protein